MWYIKSVLYQPAGRCFVDDMVASVGADMHGIRIMLIVPAVSKMLKVLKVPPHGNIIFENGKHDAGYYLALPRNYG